MVIKFMIYGISGCCKDCKNRHPLCHSKCEEYKEFKLKIEEVKKKKKYDSFNRSSGWGYIPTKNK